MYAIRFASRSPALVLPVANIGCGTQKFRMTSKSDRYERQTIRLSFICALLSDRIRP
jgi:hypothetical protein